jgi:site-specific DNA recombinase
MTTILWARRSKEDTVRRGSGVESVALQIENARRFATGQGWRDPFSEVIAEGETGAEIHRRPDIRRVLELAREGGASRIVVRDLDRVARNALWQAWLLAELDRAGVELWTYSDGARPELRGLGFAMTALRSVMAEGERAQTAKRIKEALRERAKKGHAVGMRRFGFRTVGNTTKHWEKNEGEIATILHVGKTFVRTDGSLRATALRMNAEGIAAPGGGTWNHVTVKHLLMADLPRGILVHGATRRVERGGSLVKETSPKDEVLRVPHPELKVWPENLLERIDALLQRGRRVSKGAAQPRHLGSSFLACAICGSSLTVSGSNMGGKSYVCSRYVQHGRKACTGIGYRSERAVDAALLGAIAPLIDRDRVLKDLRERLQSRATTDAREAERTRVARSLAEVERKSRNVGLAIATNDHPPPTLVAMVQELDGRAEGLRTQLKALEAKPARAVDLRKLLKQIGSRLDELASLHSAGGVEARPLLAAVLGDGRFAVTPIEVDGQRRWQLAATIPAGWLLSNVGKDASGFCPWCGVLRASPHASPRPPPSVLPTAPPAPCEA